MQVLFLLSSDVFLTFLLWTYFYILGLSSQSGFYFQGFLGSKLRNGSLVFWPSNLCLWEMHWFQDSKSTFIMNDFKFSTKCFWDSWILVYCQFDNCFTFAGNEKLHFSLNCIFYCCLVKGVLSLKACSNLPCEGSCL